MALAGGGDLTEGVLAGAPSVDADLLSLLEVLVDREELLDLRPQEQRQVIGAALALT